jgi:DNA polymerase-3 subunit gamma/tau
MSYQALARKWRPQNFEDVVGQSHVVSALSNALEQDRVHHAFLFSGTRGVGKTTLARILAKSLNCETGPSALPCGGCSTCQSVDEGRFIDLIEIDAASRTRVDDTREILDNVQYAPTMGRYKIYLIDEVHMLSGHSFNALLKTLEEPPPHVKFLLATTDPQKLPATILSRCLQFNLRALSAAEISSQLKKIADAEGLSTDDSGLQILSRAANGSMRDALSLMDQGIAFGKGTVKGQDVRDMLGMIETHHVDTILRSLARGDGVVLMETVSQMNERAIDYLNALDEILMTLHHVSLYQVVPEAVKVKQADTELVQFLAEIFSKQDVQLFYQIGLMGKKDLRFAPDPGSGFEMVLLRMLAFQVNNDASTRVTEDTGPIKEKAANPKTIKRASETRAPEPIPHVSDDAIEEKVDPKASMMLKDTGHVASNLCDAAAWTDFVDQSGVTGVTKELAMNIAPERYDSANGTLFLAIEQRLSGLLTDSRQQALTQLLSKYCADSVKINIVEKEEVTAETPAAVHARQAQEDKDRAYKTLIEDPTVQDLVSVFNATVIPESVKSGNLERKS